MRRVDNIIIARGGRLNENQQQQLNLTFTTDEIKNVVFSIPNDKSPGIDGYSSNFFKKSWHIIGFDIIEVVADFFISGKLLKEVNVTVITLISKIKNTLLQ